MKKRRFGAFSALVCLFSASASAQALSLAPADLRIEEKGDGGYHLYIRAMKGLGSVLLTESTKDPKGKLDSYAFRAKDWNAINGNERRLLDGAFIPSKSKVYSLVDSTAEADAALGSAFHVFIPYVVAYGYSWSRNGEVFLSDGTFMNIRAFAKPYADYTGAFLDNPFTISVVQKASVRPREAPASTQPQTDIYMQDTVRAFSDIALGNEGTIAYSTGEADITKVLERILDAEKGKEVDLVICLDTTDSMANDIDAVKKSIPDMIQSKVGSFKSFRLGLVLYKDYFEDYVVKKFDFTKDFVGFTSWVQSVRVAGGRDIPEAVYEALYMAVTDFAWAAERKLVVLIGDAPPHPLPRGKIGKADVEKASRASGVALSVIILPN